MRSIPNKNSARGKSTGTAKSRFGIKVQPGASKNAVLGRMEDEWKVALTAPPVEGRANRACIEFLARRLGVSKSSLTIVRGQTSRHKVIEVEGLSGEEIRAKLEAAEKK